MSSGLLAGDKTVRRLLVTDGAELSVLLDDAAERRLRVVVEEAEPAFARGLREEAALGFERLHGEEVVAHDPREREVRARRDEVGEAVERLAAAPEPEALHRARVARDRLQREAGQDFVGRGLQFELAALAERPP